MIIHLKINDVSDLKIDVSDQMHHDMAECRKLLDEEQREVKDCRQCSWNDIRFGIQNFCILDEVVTAVLGKKDICNGCFGAAGGDCDECQRKESIKSGKPD